MATITLRNGTQVVVPDTVAAEYVSRGPVEVTPVPAVPDLDDMTVEQLREHAEDLGIDLGTARLKADIRAAIDQAG